ncbi:uncharacterized protein [Onthophagus taurus]|uniref:uncharacterized protein n=1 Tax=Onthophagus taurus TaxID=166361 RepID=UPI000C20DB44|nr:uncharacterized protein LOC111426838 [Onthophagus taurus]
MRIKIILLMFLLHSSLARRKNYKQEIDTELIEESDQFENNETPETHKVDNKGSDWFSELLYKMSIFIGLEKSEPIQDEDEENQSSYWNFESMVEYAYASLQRGYEMLTKRMPALDFRRSNSEMGNLSVNLEEILIEILLNLPPDVGYGK